MDIMCLVFSGLVLLIRPHLHVNGIKRNSFLHQKRGKDYLIIIGAIDSRSNEKGYVCRFSLEEWNENTKQYQNLQLTDNPEK